MPMDKRTYPANWNEISLDVRNDAKWRCEWCGAASKRPHPTTGSKVILTVAHLGTAHEDGTKGDKTNKMDIRRENLAALCQRCHLNYDRDEHANTRRKNKLKVQPMLL
jgi:hypothetical protein